MTNSYFITATGTDIGKTFITQAIIHQLRAIGQTVQAYKPIASGFNEQALEETDAGKLLTALTRPVTLEQVEAIAPWRFSEALSPHIAAEREVRTLDLDALIEWCLSKTKQEGITLIEGVGGVMVPLNRQHTVLDWAARLSIPTLLVTGSYLGTLSHTLTAIHALQSRNAPLAGIVITESHEGTMAAEESRDGLRGFMPDSLPVVCAPYTKEGFASLPNLLSLLHERPTAT